MKDYERVEAGMKGKREGGKGESLRSDQTELKKKQS